MYFFACPLKNISCIMNQSGWKIPFNTSLRTGAKIFHDTIYIIIFIVESLTEFSMLSIHSLHAQVNFS